MANQSKFVPPELLYLVLEHLKIEEQFMLRRVNKDFKHVVENSVWPSTKIFSINPAGNVNRLCHRDWEQMLSHMTNLKIFHTYYVFKRREHAHIVKLLAEYCQSISSFGGGASGVICQWSIEYLKELSKHGVYDTSIIFNVDFKKSNVKELDCLDPRLNFRIYSYSNNHFIPARYRDKIHSAFCLDVSKPYLPNIEEVWSLSYFHPEEASKYHQQLTSIIICPLYDSPDLHFFVNLKRIHIQNYERDMDYDEELGYVMTLERYLNSDASCHLKSLRVELKHDKNINRLMEFLSSLNRPKKWKRLAVKKAGSHGPGFELYRNMIIVTLAWTSQPVTWITNLIERVTSPYKIRIEYLNWNLKMSKVQFDNWKLWFETYASNRRNMQIKLKITPTRNSFRGAHIKQDNWSISYPNIMIITDP